MNTPTGGQGSAASAGALPDVNTATFPAERVWVALNQSACFHFYAVPSRREAGRYSTSSGGGRGLEIRLDLHPFNTRVDLTAGVHATPAVGKSAASYRSRWLFTAAEVSWRPGAEPPPARLDPGAEQGFVLLGDLVRFGEKKRHGFSGYGIGRTFPGVHGQDDRVAVAAIGNLLQGFGKFRGMEGIYVLNGVLSLEEGFRGDVTLRVHDHRGLFRPPGELPESETVSVRSDAAYIAMLGRKASPRDRSEIAPAPGGQPNLVNLSTSAEMRLAEFYFSDGAGGLFVRVDEGPVLAALDAAITLDIQALPGTADSPNTFTTRNVYHFRDPSCREVGLLEVDLKLGRSFDLSFPDLPGQRGLRFGGAGEIVQASGIFEGSRGVVSVNSAIGIAPHVLSITQTVRLAKHAQGAASGLPAAAAETAPTLPSPRPRAGAEGRSTQVTEHDLLLPIGLRMHYRESGSHNDPPILMLHGNPGNSEAWTHVMELLSDIGHCIAPDLMGFGGSNKPHVPPSFYNQAEYLDQFVDSLGLRGITLFIQDWGGALGFDHAVRHQDNIRAIAFFESILKPYESWNTFPQQVDPAKLAQDDPQQSKSALARRKFRDFRQDETLGGSGWQQVTVDNVFLKVFMGPLLGHPFDPREIPEPQADPVLGPLLEPYLEPFPTIWSRNSIWRLSREIPIAGAPADTVATIGHYSRVLADWDVPKLLIYSDKGPTLKEEHARWVRENWGENLTVHNLDTIPGVEVVEGTHFLQQTHPDLIGQLFRDWYLALP